MKQRRGLLDRLDLMDAAKPRQILIELCGNERVIVENHCGVIRYGNELIAIRARRGSILLKRPGTWVSASKSKNTE